MKSLSDEIVEMKEVKLAPDVCARMLWPGNVRKSVKKIKPLIDKYVEMIVDKEAMMQEVKEIFGDELC